MGPSAEEAAVGTYDHYATPVEPGTWDVPAAGASRFSWEYDDGRSRLLDLYQRGKDKQFDAATQAMDEARHVELFARFMREKIGLYYPVNPDLAKLLADALSDSRWDMPYLGMQVLIEGLALAAFGVHRDIANNALVKQLLAYVMQDEARHVAFGRLALRDYYAELTEAERADREEFIV